MFVDFRGDWPPPEPWRPKPTPPRLSRRGERVMTWIVVFNLVMLVLGPLAGASLVEVVVAMLR